MRYVAQCNCWVLQKMVLQASSRQELMLSQLWWTTPFVEKTPDGWKCKIRNPFSNGLVRGLLNDFRSFRKSRLKNKTNMGVGQKPTKSHWNLLEDGLAIPQGTWPTTCSIVSSNMFVCQPKEPVHSKQLAKRYLYWIRLNKAAYPIRTY